jgi:serine/threonine-protein kinase RsbW
VHGPQSSGGLFFRCGGVLQEDGAIQLSRDQLLKLEFSSDPNVLCVVRGAVERVAEMIGFAPPDSRLVVRAVDEALSNVIRHCYHGRLDQPIELYFRRVRRESESGREEGLEVLLCDRGPEIDRTKLCGRAFEDVRPGGLGLHFIQEAMDTVEYERMGDTNCLRLAKYLQPAKLHPEP